MPLDKEQAERIKGKPKASLNRSTYRSIVTGIIFQSLRNLKELLVFINFGLLLEVIQTVFAMSPKFTPEKDIPSLAQKVILVTGG